MTSSTIILLVIITILAIIATFLGLELLKKFRFLLHHYIDLTETGQSATFYYDGCARGEKPGLKKIIIESESRKKFGALIGFRFELFGTVGFDPFGHIVSDNNGFACFETYLGRKPATFFIISSTTGRLKIRIADESGKSIPTARFKPHWFQKLS